MNKLPYLYKNRLGTFYLRIKRNGREIKRSLRTKDFARAKLLAIAFNLEMAIRGREMPAMTGPKISDFEFTKPDSDEMPREFDVVLPNGTQISGLNSDDDIRRAKELFGSQFAEAIAAAPASPFIPPILPASALAAISAQRATPIGLPIRKLLELYEAQRKLENVPKTVDAKVATIEGFIKLFGERAITGYGFDEAIAYKNRLIAGKSSPSRINAKLSFMRDFILYAIENKQYFSTNPFENSKISKSSKIKQATRSYEPFTQDELAIIFEASNYTLDPKKPGYYWLPFLALYTGARLDELASLDTEQIRQEGGVHFIDVVKAKNGPSQRRIPLHTMIVESNFLSYVAQRARDRKSKQLFPHLPPSANGHGKNVTRRFGQLLDQRGITSPRKVFHSFRHTFINRMSELNAHPAMLMALVGHYEQSAVDLSAPHFQHYQHAKNLRALKETIDRFDITLPIHF